jgi:hypothetical protein
MLRLAIIHFLSALGLKLWPHAEPFFKRCKPLGLVLFLACLAVMLLTLFAGCASKGQLATKLPLYNYKGDIELTVDGKKFEGMGVTTIEGPKSIKLKSKARFDLLRISSCHREMTQEKVDWKEAWFGMGGESAQAYTYQYEPLPVEQEKFCPLYFEAYEKRNGSLDGVVAAWGYLAFRTNEFLPAKTECNGTRWTFKGISVCQTRAGLEQTIAFEKPITKYFSNELCEIRDIDEKSFRVRGGKGFCQATFTDGVSRHRLVLLGYDEVLIRGE